MSGWVCSQAQLHCLFQSPGSLWERGRKPHCDLRASLTPCSHDTTLEMGMSHPRSPFPIPRWTTCVWLRRQKVTSNRRIRGHNGQRLACNRQPQAKRAPPGASPAWAPQSTHLACWTPEVDQTQDAQGCERPRPSRGSRLAMATGDHTPATHLPSAPRAQHPEILMPG